MQDLAALAHDTAPRILVIGTSAAGKSAFAASLARTLDVTFVELDPLFWDRDWKPKPQAEFLRLIDEATAAPHWVVDGNYGSVRAHLWPRAHTVVWLNYSLPRVLWRGFKRTLSRAFGGQELWHGNRESWRRAFLSRESILVWIITTHRRRTRELAALRDSGVYGLQWLEFTRPRQASDWLERLAHPRAAPR